MSNAPYDPTLKTLVEMAPATWPVFLGRPAAPTDVIDADIATVSGAADKVLRVAAAAPYLLHLEFVAGHDSAALPRKLHFRNALLEDRHDLPVYSGVVLLRPEADSPQLTGVYRRAIPGEAEYLTFRYQVERVWQMAPESLLAGGLPLLPLAPISAVTDAEVPGIISRMKQRLSRRRARRQAPAIWAASFLLAGLRYDEDRANELFREVRSMQESSTYQGILRAHSRKLLRLAGDDAFGMPDAETARTIEQIDDLERLEDMVRRVRTATNWEELLGASTSRRRGGRRRSS